MKKAFSKFFVPLLIIIILSSCFKEDKVSPVIALSGEKVMSINLGDEFLDPGYSARDNRDGDITYLVEVKGNVNYNVAGIYHLTYNVVDASGNFATEQIRTVYVTHYNESISGIFNADSKCSTYSVDNINNFGKIDPDKSGNPKEAVLSSLENLPRGEFLRFTLLSNTGQSIEIPSQNIGDTVYFGSGEINSTGSLMNFIIVSKTENYTDSCKISLTRDIR